MAGVAEMDAVPGTKLDAPLSFGLNDLKQLFEDPVLAVLRIDLARELLEIAALALAPVKIDVKSRRMGTVVD